MDGTLLFTSGKAQLEGLALRASKKRVFPLVMTKLNVASCSKMRKGEVHWSKKAIHLLADYIEDLTEADMKAAMIKGLCNKVAVKNVPELA